MRKYQVSVYWETEVEAEEEGEALMDAASRFDFVGEARAVEIEDEGAE